MRSYYQGFFIRICSEANNYPVLRTKICSSTNKYINLTVTILLENFLYLLGVYMQFLFAS